MNIRRILNDIAVERDRQETLREQGKFKATCASTDEYELSDARCLNVLGEELLEAAEELITTGLHLTRTVNDRIDQFSDQKTEERLASLAKIRDELIQVSAVAVAWVQRVDYYSGS